MTYELPTNISNYSGLLTFANNSTEGFFGLAILILIFVVVFISLKSYSSARAFAGSSFITMIGAIFFRIMGLVNDAIMIIFILVCAISFIWLWMENSREY